MGDDPDIRVEMAIDCDVFNNELSLSESHQWNGIWRFKEEFNKELNSLLGARWDERIMNKNGDFAFVQEGSVKFWVHSRDPI